MKLLLTTNGRLFKNEKNEYYTSIVYSYDFFKRYFAVFDEIRLVAHVETTDADLSGMLRVDGPGLEVYDIAFPHGKWAYIQSYFHIEHQLKDAVAGCDAAVFRIPDQLAFQTIPKAKKQGLPVGVEVIANSWALYEKGAMGGVLRPFLRVLWDLQEKKACKTADASCYVTKQAIQNRYPPNTAKGAFSNSCSDVDITPFRGTARDYGAAPLKKIRILHIAGSIAVKAKGHSELLQAVGILKRSGMETECVLVGGDALSTENAALVRSEDLKILCKGRCTAAEIAEEMQKADMFVFPSYREGLPRVVVEAMASGLVCVATSIDGIRELLPPEVLVPVKDAERLAEVIMTLAENPRQMTAQSLRNIQEAEKYSPEHISERRNAFYQYLYDEASRKNGEM